MMYVKHLEWTPFYTSIKDYGQQFVNQYIAEYFAKRSGDWHTIIHKEYKPFPEWLTEGLPIEPEIFQIFAINPNSVGMIHRDGLDRKSALNIPLANCDKGYMDWFGEIFEEVKIVNKFTQVRKTSAEKSHDEYRSTETPAHRCRIETPVVVDTDTWHRIDNTDNDNYRFMFSLRFVGNPSFEELAELFK